MRTRKPGAPGCGGLPITINQRGETIADQQAVGGIQIRWD
jgi:hypothetical protein